MLNFTFQEFGDDCFMRFMAQIMGPPNLVWHGKNTIYSGSSCDVNTQEELLWMVLLLFRIPIAGVLSLWKYKMAWLVLQNLRDKIVWGQNMAAAGCWGSSMVIREAVVYKQKHFLSSGKYVKWPPCSPWTCVAPSKIRFEAVLLVAFNFQTTRILKTKTIRNQNWLIYGRNVMILW